jgi:hypothetical protein
LRSIRESILIIIDNYKYIKEGKKGTFPEKKNKLYNEMKSKKAENDKIF